MRFHGTIDRILRNGGAVSRELSAFVFACALAAAGCASAGLDPAPDLFDAQRDLRGETSVFDGAQGFGTATAAGRAGEVLRVTALAPAGPGSLREAMAAQGPRRIVFDVAGTIALESPLVIEHPGCTVDGSTAPGEGITITGAGIVVRASDVLLRHLRVRVGDDPGGPAPGGRDGISVYKEPDAPEPVRNVVIDHCSIYWAIDENTSTWYDGVGDVTFSHCIIAEGLDDSLHPKGPHSKGLLIGDHARRVSVIRCLFAHNDRRNPLIKGNVSALVVNNVIYNPGGAAVHMSDPEGSGPSVATVVGNVLVPGPDTRSGLPFFHSDAPARRQSTLHAADNIVLDEGGHARPGEVPEGMLAEERRVWVAPLDVLPTGGVLDVVLAEAGALPGRRDAHDRRIIEEVRTRGGRIIDSPAEVATD